MKRIRNSFVSFTLTQSGPTDPNTDMYSFLIALFFSWVICCLLLSLLLSFGLVYLKGRYFLKYVTTYINVKKNFRGHCVMSERVVSLTVSKNLNISALLWMKNLYPLQTSISCLSSSSTSCSNYVRNYSISELAAPQWILICPKDHFLPPWRFNYNYI